MDSTHNAPNGTRRVLCAELVDHILGYLRLDDDQQSLSTCSFVCKMWAESAARHVLSTIFINPTILVQGDDGIIPAYFAARECPRVTRNARDVKLKTTKAEQTKRIRGDELSLNIVPVQLIADIVATFPRLRSIEIFEVWIGTTIPESLSTLPFARTTPPAGAIRKLVIECSLNIYNTLPLRDLLDIFTEIKTLHLYLTSDKPIDSDSPSGIVVKQSAGVPNTGPKVKHLVLEQDPFVCLMPNSRLFRMAIDCTDTSSLQSLCFLDYQTWCPPGTDNVHAVNAMLREHASIIHTFSLNLPYDALQLGGMSLRTVNHTPSTMLTTLLSSPCHRGVGACL